MRRVSRIYMWDYLIVEKQTSDKAIIPSLVRIELFETEQIIMDITLDLQPNEIEYYSEKLFRLCNIRIKLITYRLSESEREISEIGQELSRLENIFCNL